MNPARRPAPCHAEQSRRWLSVFPHTVRRLALGLAVLATGAGWASVARSEGETVIRLMSYNIRYLNNNDGEDVWSARKATVADTLRTADVVGLQEVVVDQLRDLQAAMPEFAWVGVGRTDGKEAGEFTPIGVRKSRLRIVESDTQWLSETPDVAGSRGWDAALPRIATWARVEDLQTGAALKVINTHFDHRGPQARLESGRLIRQMVQDSDADLPVVVMGDLNAAPDSPPLQALTAEGPRQLRDSRAVTSTPPAGPVGTWNGFREIDDRRIDHILVTPGVEVRSYEVLDPRTPQGRFGSDHLPVVVTVQVSE